MAVSRTFDIYTRVSDVGDREGDSYGSPETQEASARACAQRLDLEIGEIVLEENVSGALAANDRELGRLIARCERGESAGIIFPRLDRLTRDVGVGGVILNRMVECGARLISADGSFDSENLTPASELVFNQLNAVGQYVRKSNRAHRIDANKRASSRGVYLAKKPPLGYMRAEASPNYVLDPARDGRRIVPDPQVAPLVREVFLRRATGETSPALARFLNEHGVQITAPGVRHLLLNRAYLGEATCQSEIKGKPTIIKNAHEPLVTEREMDAAHAKGGPYHPRDGSLAQQVQLPGLVVCASCGRRLQTGGYGKKGARKAHYFCNAPKGKCSAQANISASRLDAHIQELVFRAIVSEEPHVMAVAAGDSRYQDALTSVEAARRDLEEYRDDLTLQRELGTKLWAEGLKPRKEALRLAQEQLAKIPPPGKPVKIKPLKPSVEQWIMLCRETNRRFIDRVEVRPVGRGRRGNVADRVDVYFIGAEKPYRSDGRKLTIDDLYKLSAMARAAAA